MESDSTLNHTAVVWETSDLLTCFQTLYVLGVTTNYLYIKNIGAKVPILANEN